MDPLEALASQSFCRVAEARQSDGNAIRLLRDGPETFPVWLEAIARAQHFVALENFILQEDATGELFVKALTAAAARGVACRVLYDWLGCLTRSSAKFWRRLSDAGVEVRRYNPPHFSNPLHWISRDHRKVLCVDGDVAFTGGLCIGQDWMGHPERNIPPWRDTAVEIHGPAVADIQAAFEDSWRAAGPNPGPAPEPTLAAQGRVDAPAGGVDISVIAGRPDIMGLYRLEQLVAEIAQHSLWLTDGYFVATTAYVRALAGAARARVDVRLLVPGSSDWPIVGALSKSAYRPLLEAGVRVFEWNGPMLHAKTGVADGCWSRIGSSNSNLASWVTNRELDVTIKNHGLAQQMMAMFESDMENATEVVLARGRSGLARPTRPKQMRQGAQSSRRRGHRLFSGAIGIGSTLTASLTHRRVLQPAESLVVLAGAAALLSLGGIALLLPRLIAWVIAIAAIWPGLALLFRGFKLWRASKPGRAA